jgi:hypothetical protein
MEDAQQQANIPRIPNHKKKKKKKRPRQDILKKRRWRV